MKNKDWPLCTLTAMFHLYIYAFRKIGKAGLYGLSRKCRWEVVNWLFDGWWLQWGLAGLLSNNAGWERDTQTEPGCTSGAAGVQMTHLKQENITQNHQNNTVQTLQGQWEHTVPRYYFTSQLCSCNYHELFFQVYHCSAECVWRCAATAVWRRTCWSEWHPRRPTPWLKTLSVRMEIKDAINTPTKHQSQSIKNGIKFRTCFILFSEYIFSELQMVHFHVLTCINKFQPVHLVVFKWFTMQTHETKLGSVKPHETAKASGVKPCLAFWLNENNMVCWRLDYWDRFKTPG